MKGKQMIALILSFGVTVAGFTYAGLPATTTDGMQNGLKGASASEETALSYISQQDAAGLAEQCIAQQIAIGNHCLWNDTTQIVETVALYDFDQHVNAYLFRLQTDGVTPGYILVDALATAPEVQSFGYDCNAMLDEMMLQRSNRKVTAEDQIVRAGDVTFLQPSLTRSGEARYTELSTGQPVDATRQELRQAYVAEKRAYTDETAVANLHTVRTVQARAAQTKSAVVQPRQVIYSYKDLPNIWTSGYRIFSTWEFPHANNCAPTAGVNFIYYWSQFHPTKRQYNLWPSALDQNIVFELLYDSMQTGSDALGTLQKDSWKGLMQYARGRRTPHAADDFSEQTFSDWGFFTRNIDNTIPVIFGVNDDPKYTDHAMLCVGYQDTSTGQYLRIADGGSNTFSNFYKYKGYTTGAWYVRW